MNMVFLVLWLALPYNGTGTLSFQFDSMEQCKANAERIVPAFQDGEFFKVTRWECKQQ
jgi:hypothetical protein